MMAHAQKPDLIFRRNGRVRLNRRGRPFSRLLAAKVGTSAVVMLDIPCSEVVWYSTGYPLHSSVSHSLPLPCVTMCHQISNALYQYFAGTYSLHFLGNDGSSQFLWNAAIYQTIQHHSPEDKYKLLTQPSQLISYFIWRILYIHSGNAQRFK